MVSHGYNCCSIVALVPSTCKPPLPVHFNYTQVEVIKRIWLHRFKIFSLLLVVLCCQFSWVAASGCPQHNRCSQNEVSPLVAFTAADVKPYTWSGMKKNMSGYTLTNEGYGWNPKTNVFVCYYPGLYFFTFSEQPSSHQRSRSLPLLL